MEGSIFGGVAGEVSLVCGECGDEFICEENGEWECICHWEPDMDQLALLLKDRNERENANLIR
ncbi:hypothetical protein COLO4_27476 [Corchorus olitorius]|uniref:Uncharacterized protein n=1 Tax=Corchorus olitorius TaxID=93759 RepID=A0A1R3HQT8_9ROSI|nr:hypothetical protein COLO4_27476 [Corchorus olitorius]